VQELYLQCYSKREIAKLVGIPETTVMDIRSEIRNFKIPYEPGLFSEGYKPDMIDKQYKEWEATRKRGRVASVHGVNVRRYRSRNEHWNLFYSVPVCSGFIRDNSHPYCKT
jgi:transposase